jgi:hypothetical protein
VAIDDVSKQALEHATGAVKDLTGSSQFAGPVAGELGQLAADKVRY